MPWWTYVSLRTMSGYLDHVCTGLCIYPPCQYDASLLQRASYLLWIAHLLKQMGNHATNIGKQIIFIEEGEDKII